MTLANASGDLTEKKLHWGEWILLPAICLGTVCFLAIATEVVARCLFPSSDSGLERCYVKNDPSGNAPVIPNSTCSERVPESKFPIEYRYDSQGHRSDVELGPKRPDTHRIVMMGSSLAMGLFIPREMTFAALLPDQLSRQTGQKVELYNEATGGKFRGGPYPLPGSPAKFNDVLSAHPDMILWIVTPADFENASPESPTFAAPVSTPSADSTTPANLWTRLERGLSDGSVAAKLRNRWEQTRASVVLKHLLLASQSQDQYVTSYLKNDFDAGFLKAEPSPQWQGLLQNFDGDAAAFEGQAKAAGVPLVAVLVPNRAQAAMISMGHWPDGYDPYKLGNELRAMIESHGGTYIDILPEFRTIPDPEQHYFPVDGHPDADGHAMIARMLAKALTNGSVPSLRSNSQTASAR